MTQDCYGECICSGIPKINDNRRQGSDMHTDIE